MPYIINHPDKYSFTGNPIMFHFYDSQPFNVTINIHVEGEIVFRLAYRSYQQGNRYVGLYDVSRILAAHIEKHAIDTSAIVGQVENFCINYRIVFNEYLTPFYEGKAFGGGISAANFSRLKQLQTNMFSYRLRNYSRQFLFTTRTNSSHLVIRESELYPFIFIHPGTPITITTSNGRTLIPEIYPADTICSIDIDKIRQAFFVAYNELPLFFAVLVDGRYSFDITLVNNHISPDCYLLKFKNSLGAYEYIELSGTAKNKIVFAEEESWQQINEYNFLKESRNRQDSQKHIEAETGYKSRDELHFILDMIKSEEIYFIDLQDPSKQEYPCIVTTEEIKIPRCITEPQSISLDIRFLTEDAFESPEIVFEYPKSIFQNLTAEGSPEINGQGFIYGDDYPFYAE